MGWIFTDLLADDVRKGTVKHLRDINTHFLTAEECILAADLQNHYPSPCRLSSSGKFGSKFSTVVVSGLLVVFVYVILIYHVKLQHASLIVVQNKTSYCSVCTQFVLSLASRLKCNL